MLKKIYRFIWSFHSCCSEVMLFFSRNCFIKKVHFYYRVLTREEKAFNLKAQCNHLNIMVLVGAGSIPYTALYYRKSFHKIVCIEKNKMLAAMARYFIGNKGIRNITVVSEDAINYNFPDSSVIFISLLTHYKEVILQKACLSRDSLICLRIPSAKSIHRYEQASILENDYCLVDLPRLAMKSALINTNNTMQDK